jgi:hypothetical protein
LDKELFIILGKIGREEASLASVCLPWKVIIVMLAPWRGALLK